ncbi:MAG: Glutamine synthetase [Verrucomicrobiota bacterium]|jgi:glutamine synthetase
MSRTAARQAAVKAAATYRSPAKPLNFKSEPATELFGCNVFSDAVMKARLPKTVYRQIRKVIEEGAKLDAACADIVASAMKDWAIEKGATHYSHVFYPLTGATAEKHDSFIVPEGSSCITEFSGKFLIQGEPDGSSFPSGGLRVTFEARGYTIWDVTSPAYILENPNGTTLCIPTCFVSWKGEALDKKTPVLRSMNAVDAQARRVLKLLDPSKTPSRVSANAGPEQEFFLVDSNLVAERPDLQFCERALLGKFSAKGQQFEDHYFGAIPERVLAYMLEVERELYKLGIPMKTRHNEVAPAQFEFAPIFETANVATDHQQMTMVVMKRLAAKYGMTAIFHEKPFAGVNGSGKHVNWSIGNASHGNLMDPGATPHENEQFLVFCAAIVRAVHVHGGLMRAAIASASNDHRLGANEAPPAIMSVYLGDQLFDVFEQLKKGAAKSSKVGGTMEVGVPQLPALQKDPGDRNRTSPFAFCGNRFEFRAVGSGQTIAGPLVVLNTIMADSLSWIADQLEAGRKVADILTEVANKHGAVIFNGNGYSKEWHEEAVRRGLKKLDTTPDALPEIVSPASIAMFAKFGVLNETETRSRYNIYCEQYNLRVKLEAKIVSEMVSTRVIPAVIRYQTELAQNAAALKAAGVEGSTCCLKKVTEQLTTLGMANKALSEKLAAIPHDDDPIVEARYFKDVVLPQMLEVRKASDALEGVVADDLWPLPTYAEMLFIR